MQNNQLPDIEKQIVDGCLRNERWAQKALYEEYKTRMYTLAYRVTNNFEDANDVLQEGFVEVFKSLRTFRHDSKLSSWIHTIIARAAYRKIKHKVRFNNTHSEDENTIINWDFEIDVQYLEEAIASLPVGYRSIFTLYEIEGFKHKEIAELLEISISTSKSQLHKAKKVLQQKLQESNF
jgi:RNA polymerase sigma factor (sigma-70 family)